MKFRISDLRNFLEISSCRTMSEGAERLQITQPALSESIKRLELDVGEVLFYRARSGISLTPGGHKILRKSKTAFIALDDIVHEGKDTDIKRLISIGCHETVGSYFLPKVLEVLRDKREFQFRLKHGLSRTVQLDIQQGRTDVGIVVNPIESPDLVIRTIATDEICVWKKSNQKEESNRIFCNPALNQSHSILKKWNRAPYEIVEVESLDLISRLVDRGCGYGIIPKRLVELLGFKLVQVDGTPTFKDQFGLVYRPEFGKNSQEKTLLDILRRSFT
ncbi:LysR family transcriptional regulator [bacterium]|nr:LysR family transcriptional regulator [bacterium]